MASAFAVPSLVFLKNDGKISRFPRYFSINRLPLHLSYPSHLRECGQFECTTLPWSIMAFQYFQASYVESIERQIFPHGLIYGKIQRCHRFNKPPALSSDHNPILRSIFCNLHAWWCRWSHNFRPKVLYICKADPIV